jgi:LytS/YehU family sensor histidine kinase
VVVKAHTHDGMLQMTIEDMGQGVIGTSFPNNGPGLGVGLANVRRRLELSYGRSATLNVSYGKHGSLVTLVIPTSLHAPVNPQELLA